VPVLFPPKSKVNVQRQTFCPFCLGVPVFLIFMLPSSSFFFFRLVSSLNFLLILDDDVSDDDDEASDGAHCPTMMFSDGCGALGGADDGGLRAPDDHLLVVEDSVPLSSHTPFTIPHPLVPCLLCLPVPLVLAGPPEDDGALPIHPKLLLLPAGVLETASCP
jgi:hypothetical protein